MSGLRHRTGSEQNIELQGLNSAGVKVAHGSQRRDSKKKGQKRELSKQWIWEILCLIGALLLLCVIIGLLVQYHDEQRPL